MHSPYRKISGAHLAHNCLASESFTKALRHVRHPTPPPPHSAGPLPWTAHPHVVLAMSPGLISSRQTGHEMPLGGGGGGGGEGACPFLGLLPPRSCRCCWGLLGVGVRDDRRRLRACLALLPPAPPPSSSSEESTMTITSAAGSAFFRFCLDGVCRPLLCPWPPGPEPGAGRTSTSSTSESSSHSTGVRCFGATRPCGMARTPLFGCAPRWSGSEVVGVTQTRYGDKSSSPGRGSAHKARMTLLLIYGPRDHGG